MILTRSRFLVGAIRSPNVSSVCTVKTRVLCSQMPERMRLWRCGFFAIVIRCHDPRAPGCNTRRSRSNPLEQLAKLIRADLGVRVAFVESGGWDTHFAQGGATGAMANLMGELAGSVAAFVEDVGENRPVTLLLVTEFGRTVAMNGAGGTDHGHGGAMMVVGHGVRGSRVHGDWLGLEKRNLYEGRDLPVTTGFSRRVFRSREQGLGASRCCCALPGLSSAVSGRHEPRLIRRVERRARQNVASMRRAHLPSPSRVG